MITFKLIALFLVVTLTNGQSHVTDIGNCKTQSGIGLNVETSATPVDAVTSSSAGLYVWPEYPGGKNSLCAYYADNFDNNVLKDLKPGKYTINLNFIVKTNGGIYQVTPDKNDISLVTEEALRITRAMRTVWLPGIINGKAASFKFNLTLDFTIPEKFKK